MIRNIWCVGRNFVDHAHELNNPIPKEPLIFLKAGSCALAPGEPIRLPAFSSQIDYEIEIALQFNEALQVDRACLALDLTARDLQQTAKNLGLPWTLAKSFIGACPMGPFFPISPHSARFTFSLSLNGEIRQSGDTNHMIFKFSDLIKFVKFRFPVCPGDLLLTGTPSGVSSIRPGDRLQAVIPKLSQADWLVT